MAFFIVVPASDLTLIWLNAFLSTRIVCFIDSKGRGARSTSIGVHFIVFLPRLVLFLLLPSLIGGLGISSLVKARGIVRIQSLRFLGLWLGFLNPKILRVASVV